MPAESTEDVYGALITDLRATVALVSPSNQVLAGILNGALAELTSMKTRLERQGHLLSESGKRESRLLRQVELQRQALAAARQETTTLTQKLQSAERLVDAWQADLSS